MWIIVGLGNPGAKYAHTRHNVGHDTIAALSEMAGSKLKPLRAARCEVAQVRLGINAGGAPAQPTVIAITQSYMNESGGPVKALLQYYRASVDNLLVIHDELDLQPHCLRLKFGGGEGGHNGLKSISGALGTREYHRLRIGVGHPGQPERVVDYVLSQFPARECVDWQITIGSAAEAAAAVVNQGFEAAQRELHSRG